MCAGTTQLAVGFDPRSNQPRAHCGSPHVRCHLGEPLVSPTPEPQSQSMPAGRAQACAPGAERPPVRCLVCLSSVAILAATLTPANAWEGVKAHVRCVLCGEGFRRDALRNLVLFLPLGMALRLCGSPITRARLVGALLSCGIEVAQGALPGRDPSLHDILFNVCGTALGSALARCARVLACPTSSLADHLTLAAALVVTTVFGLTGSLLAPAFPRGPYFGGTNVLQTTATPGDAWVWIAFAPVWRLV